jgi:Asp-tRNA(Asn)/Glu-tRNA(Gln) amidotransferase A subunit family amidase
MKKRFKIYISGPMTGLPNHNEEAFTDAAAALRKKGHIVFNPAENDDGSRDKSWAFYMRLDVRSVSLADYMVILPGWENSKGAQLEIAIAERLEIPIYHLSDFLAQKKPQAIKPRVIVRTTLDNESPSEMAYRIVRGERRSNYGHPLDDYTRTSGMMSALIDREITPVQSILNMIIVKISRLMHTPGHFDSWVDICGYAECGWMAYEEEQKREKWADWWTE